MTYFALSGLEQRVSVLVTSCALSVCEKSRKNKKIIVCNCTNYMPAHGQLAAFSCYHFDRLIRFLPATPTPAPSFGCVTVQLWGEPPSLPCPHSLHFCIPCCGAVCSAVLQAVCPCLLVAVHGNKGSRRSNVSSSQTTRVHSSDRYGRN